MTGKGFSLGYQSNWINAGQNRRRHKPTKEGAAFMTGIFWLIVASLVVCAFI